MEPIKKHDKRILDNAPFGQLGLITVSGCEEMGREIDVYLQDWRAERQHEHEDSPAFAGYLRPTYIIDTKEPRFGTGEGKGVVSQSVRGMDLYILVDVVIYVTVVLALVSSILQPELDLTANSETIR